MGSCLNHGLRRLHGGKSRDGIGLDVEWDFYRNRMGADRKSQSQREIHMAQDLLLDLLSPSLFGRLIPPGNEWSIAPNVGLEAKPTKLGREVATWRSLLHERLVRHAHPTEVLSRAGGPTYRDGCGPGARPGGRSYKWHQMVYGIRRQDGGDAVRYSYIFFGKIVIEMKIIVASIILSAVIAVSGVAQEYAQWGLPEGAKWRIGRGAMQELAYSPDGTRLAVASSIGIWLYDTETLKEAALLTNHTAEVLSVAYSPDGSLLASGSEDMTARLWDANSAEQKHPPLRHAAPVVSVRFSPDGSMLASVSKRQAQIWDAGTDVKNHTLAGHTRAVTSIAFSPDGKVLDTGSDDRTVRVWDAKTGELLRTIHTDPHQVKSLAFSPDGKTIVTGLTGATLCLWDTDTGDLQWKRARHLKSTPRVEFAPDGERIVAGSVGEVTLWHAATGTLQRRLTGPSGDVFSVAYSPDGGTIVSASEDNILRFWEAESGVLLRSIDWMEKRFRSAAISPDGRLLAIGGYQTVRLWDAKSGEHLRTLSGHGDRVFSLAFSRDGRLLASGGRPGVLLWDITAGKLLRTLSEFQDIVVNLAFSPDGSVLATGDGQNIHLWDTESGEQLQSLNGHEEFVSNLAFSRDGELLASSGRKEILLWDANAGKHLRTMIGFTRDEVKGVAFSGDGKTLYCATSKELRLWDIDTGEYRHMPTGIESGQAGAAFSPDGGLLALWNKAGIHLWNTDAGEHLGTLTGHTAKIDYAAIDSNRRALASVSRAGSALLWEIKLPAASATISLVPSSAPSPSVGEKFTLSIEIENGENVSAYQATVSFNPATLRFVETAAGDYLPEGAFIVPAVLDGHQLTVGAAALGGGSHGSGTLAALTFEVAAVKSSTVALSEASLVDSNAKQTFPRLSDAQVVVPYRVVGDTNGDGVISILDLPQVAARLTEASETDAEINEDGVVDISDMFQAVTDVEIANTEPAAYLAALSMLTSTDVAEWLEQQQESNLAEAALKRSIHSLQHQLAVCVPGETALLPNYPNPFDRETWIPYHLAFKMEVYITIYGEKGLPVRHLAMGSQNPGYYVGLSRAAYWDGRNDDGAPVPSGAYIYELVTWDHMASRRMKKTAGSD